MVNSFTFISILKRVKKFYTLSKQIQTVQLQISQLIRALVSHQQQQPQQPQPVPPLLQPLALPPLIQLPPPLPLLL